MQDKMITANKTGPKIFKYVQSTLASRIFLPSSVFPSTMKPTNKKIMTIATR